MKFGGTSMGSAERIRTAAELSLAQFRRRPVLVVVSAMAKVTDLLLETLTHAEHGRPAVEANIQLLQQRHFEACEQLLPPAQRASTLAAIETLISEFRRIAHGILMLGERPPRSVDEAVAVGEKLSALLLARYLESLGVPSAAVSGSEVIVTDNQFGNASPLMPQTRQRAREKLLPLLETGVLPVVTGFNGATTDGRPTTLGRGGSDYSASILSAALDASELWIWSDVDGIMTADPRLVHNAAPLAEISYNEAAELAYNGAKVLHPRTLAPLIDKQIPVWSKNSFAPHKPGTRIGAHTPAVKGPRAVTSTSNVALISIDPASASVNGAEIMGRSLETLARAGVEILAFTSSSYRQNFCFLIRRDEVPAAMEALQAALALELAHGYLHPIDVDTDVGLLAVVGEGMQGTPGIAGRIFTAISREMVNIIAIAQGSSELTIAIVVAKTGLERAVRAVHEECRLAEQASLCAAPPPLTSAEAV
jgi:aspartate kinase